MGQEDPSAHSLCRGTSRKGAGRRLREGSPQGGVFKPTPAVGNSSPGAVGTLEKVKSTPLVGGEGAGLFHWPGRDCLLHKSVLPQLGSRSSGKETQTRKHEAEASAVPRAHTSVRRSLSGLCGRAWHLLECCKLGASLAHPSPGPGCQTVCWCSSSHQVLRPWGVGGTLADSVFCSPNDGVQSPSLFSLATWNPDF